MINKSFYLCFFFFFIQSIYCQKTINFIDKDGYECFGMPFPYSINSEFYLENKGLIKKYKLNYWIYVEDGTMKNQDYYAPGVGSHMIHEFQSDSTILIVFLKYTKYRYLILDKFEFLNKYISGRFFYKTSEINGIEDNQIFTLAHFNKDYLFHQYFDSICISLKADTIKKKIINLNYKNVKCFNNYYMDFPSEYDTELPEWCYNGIDGKLNNSLDSIPVKSKPNTNSKILFFLKKNMDFRYWEDNNSDFLKVDFLIDKYPGKCIGFVRKTEICKK